MNTSQILNRTADLLNTATTTLLAHPDALDRAPELMELHLAEGKVRAAVTDQPTEDASTDIETGPVQTDPGVLLAEAARLLVSCCGDFGQRIRLISTLPLPAAGNCSGLRWDAGSRALNAGGGCCKTPRYRQ